MELFAIVVALRTWCHFLLGKHFDVYTDHHSLHYIHTQPILTDRQACWMQTLAAYDMEIKYIAGKTNIVADGLS